MQVTKTGFTAEVKRQHISEVSPYRKTSCHSTKGYKVWNVLVNGENCEYMQPNKKTADAFAYFVENEWHGVGDPNLPFDRWMAYLERQRVLNQEAK